MVTFGVLPVVRLFFCVVVIGGPRGPGVEPGNAAPMSSATDSAGVATDRQRGSPWSFAAV
eukprot:2432832-Lingulodinium_polyedra.AAC.1